MKTIISGFIITLLLVITGLSCQDVSMPLAEPEVELVGPTWQLMAFVEADGDQILVESLPERGRGYTVEFRGQTSEECNFTEEPKGHWCMRAQGHPNEGWFTYDLGKDDRSLTIYLHALTEVLPPSRAKEQEFFDALKAATSYQINGKQLRLFYGDGNTLLFEPTESDEEE